MQSESQPSTTQFGRNELDATNGLLSPDTQAMTDTSRTMSAIVQAATVLHSLMPGAACLSGGQQTASVNYSGGANQPVSFSVTSNQSGNFALSSSQQSGFTVNAAQNALPFVNFATSTIGTPLLSQPSTASPQTTVLSNGSMLTLLGSPQTRKALGGNDSGHAQTQTTTHYAALLPKPAGYSRVATKQGTSAKHVHPTSTKPVSCAKSSPNDADTLARSADSHAKPTRCDKPATAESPKQRTAATPVSSSQRTHRRAIVCKRQFAPLHIQPHPSAAASGGSLFAPPAYTTVLGPGNTTANPPGTPASTSAGAPQSAGNYVVNAAATNTLTAFLTPGTNTLHILPLGAMQQLAQLQQAVANVSAAVNSVPATPSVSTSVAPSTSTGTNSQLATAATQQTSPNLPTSTVKHEQLSVRADDNQETKSRMAAKTDSDDECEVGLRIVENDENEDDDEHDDSSPKSKRQRQTERRRHNKRAARKRERTDKPASKQSPAGDPPPPTSACNATNQLDENDPDDEEEDDDEGSTANGRRRPGRPRKNDLPVLSKHPLRFTIITTDKRNLVAATSGDSKRRGRPQRDEAPVIADAKNEPEPLQSTSGKRKCDSMPSNTRRLTGDSQSPKRPVTESARHVVDGFVICELADCVNDALVSISCSPPLPATTKPSPAQPSATADSKPSPKTACERESSRKSAITRLRCVVCACEAEMRVDPDEPDAARRVRRLVELGVCSYRCKQKFLSKREKMKRESLVRQLEQLDSGANTTAPASTSVSAKSSSNSNAKRRTTQQQRMMNALAKRGRFRLASTAPKRPPSSSIASSSNRTPRRLQVSSNESDVDSASILSNSETDAGTATPTTTQPPFANSPDLIANIRRANRPVATATASTRSQRPKAKQPLRPVETMPDYLEDEPPSKSASPRCTRSQARRDGPETNEPNVACQPNRFGPTPATGAPAKLKSPPVALVSPSNSLLTPTSLSELSSSAFSPTFSPPFVRRSTAEDSCSTITTQPLAGASSSVRPGPPQEQPIQIAMPEKCSSDPSKWSVDQVCEFLRSRPWLAEYAAHFRANEIDGHALSLLHVDHLVGTLRMKLGPALKLHDLVGRLKASAAATSVTDAPSQPALVSVPGPASLPVAQHSDSDDELNVEDV